MTGNEVWNKVDLSFRWKEINNVAAYVLHVYLLVDLIII